MFIYNFKLQRNAYHTDLKKKNSIKDFMVGLRYSWVKKGENEFHFYARKIETKRHRIELSELTQVLYIEHYPGLMAYPQAHLRQKTLFWLLKSKTQTKMYKICLQTVALLIFLEIIKVNDVSILSKRKS